MYEHKDYPMWVYKAGEGRIVNDKAEHEAAKKDGYGKSKAPAKKKDK